MRKILFLTLLFWVAAATIAAQEKRPDFSGLWLLDLNRSQLAEGEQIEAMTVEVRQTENQIEVAVMTRHRQQIERSNRPAPDDRVAAEAGATRSVSRSAFSYGFLGDDPKVFWSGDGRLKFLAPVVETWQLLDEGLTLKITRERETPDGIATTELIFEKGSFRSDRRAPSKNPSTEADSSNAPNQAKMISAGVLNGKALLLVKPRYPAEARRANAGGAVNVQVTIDEDGKIIAARAVSGHPLLREASEEAARQSRFSPTTLQGTAVKVTGIIVFNFVP